MPPRTHVPQWARRILIALSVGIMMMVTTYLCAWFNFRDAHGYRFLHEDAFKSLGSLREQLEEYRLANGQFPEQLIAIKDLLYHEDPWGNPFQYHKESKGFTLYSFGPDGRPGGQGFDMDLNISDVPLDREYVRALQHMASPTLWQFTMECPTRGILLASALTGTCAFLVCFLTLKPGNENLKSALIRLILTLFFSLLFSLWIAAAHVPNHH